MVLSGLPVKYEPLILGLVAAALVFWLLAQRHGRPQALEQANKDGVNDRPEAAAK
jgi:hypothetical protein